MINAIKTGNSSLRTPGWRWTAVVASASPTITITEQRILDQRIRADVMNVLARNPDLAGRDTSLVQGVKYVVNEIRPRVGVVSN